MRNSFAVALSFLFACNNSVPPVEISAKPVNETQGYIIGGEPTTGYPGVVALYAIADGAEGGSLCTAEVVSPTVILTAAHCVHPDLVGADVTFWVLTGPDLTNKDTPSPRLAVREVHWDKEFNKANLLNGHDIAVAILEEPTDLPAIKINRAPLSDEMQDAPALIVGYGLNKGYPQKGAGIKRVATVKLNSFDDKFVKTGGWGARICSGDSGGPVLMDIDGELHIVGVNSFGLVFCLGQGNSTRVDSYLDFVDTYLQ